jgi:hypothetical protein
MALKARIASLEEAPETARSFYTQDGDGFALTVEGLVPKTRVDEFRETNITLRRQMDELAEKFSGIDPEQARQLMDRAAKERDKKLIDAGKIDDLLNERTGAMKTEHEKVLKAAQDANAALTTQLEGLVIDGAIRDAASKAGVRPSAIEDVLLRGRAVFRLAEGKAVAMDGDKPIYGGKGEPVTVAEWVDGLTGKAPHLFEESRGAGAGGGGGGGNGAVTSRADPNAFLRNMAKIATGEMRVA